MSNRAPNLTLTSGQATIVESDGRFIGHVLIRTRRLYKGISRCVRHARCFDSNLICDYQLTDCDGDTMPCNSTDGDGSRACSVHRTFQLDDFTQFPWYTSLYSKPNSALLEKNSPPSDGQLPFLRLNLVEAMAELYKVDQKLRSNQSLPSDAISHRDRLQKVVDDYRSVLSPVRRVPYEIVHRILEINGPRGWGRATVKPRSNHVMLYNGPWRLSKVCQQWRAVALQSTEFWCDIHICFAPTADRASLGLRALLDEGVQRSAERKLQVVLSCDPYEEHYEEDSGREAVNAFKALFAHSEQIGVLTVDATFSYELDFIYRSSCYRFSSLQSLSICIWETCDPRLGAQLLDAFEEAFYLREVQLVGVQVGKPYGNLYFPWDNLQSFEHRASLSLDNVLIILITCPKLQKYIVSGPVTDALTITPFFPILHTALTYLELSVKSASLLQYTQIPSLTVLHVEHVDSSLQLTHLIRFISRSRCSIQELELFVEVFHLECDSLLELLPSVTRLTLGLQNMTQLNRFQSDLTPERLPLLEKLEIRMLAWAHRMTPYTPHLMPTLIHIIQSRSTRLQSFAFYLPTSYGDRQSMREDIKGLQVLLAPYSQELRTRIEAGTKLCLFLGALSSFSLHDNASD
jgi:hypothetical protein